MRGGIREGGLHPGVRALTGAVRGPFNSSDRAPILVLRLAPASFLVTPVSGPLAMVEATQHHDFVLLDDEEEGVRESAKDRLVYAAMDLWKRPGESQNAGGRSIDSSRKLGAQALRPLLVPRTGLEDVQAGFRAEAQSH
jgi:hypothetical protein